MNGVSMTQEIQKAQELREPQETYMCLVCSKNYIPENEWITHIEDHEKSNTLVPTVPVSSTIRNVYCPKCYMNRLSSVDKCLGCENKKEKSDKLHYRIVNLLYSARLTESSKRRKLEEELTQKNKKIKRGNLY
jgi:hypothetical protein